MSIRMKLVLSNIAMIVIPIIIMALTAAIYFVQSYSHDPSTRPGTGTGAVGRPYPEFGGAWNDDIYKGLVFLLDNDPDAVLDAGVRQRLAAQLQDRRAGLVLYHGKERIDTLSSITGDEAVAKAVAEQGASDSRRRITVNGKRYTVEGHSFTFRDGSNGTAYYYSELSFSAFSNGVFPRAFLFLLLVVGLTNGVLTFLVSRSIIKPLQTLKLAAEQIKEGDLEQPLELRRKDEFGRLGSTFEEMRVRLKESIGLQLQYEENRKELWSSISHDLKTPITAILSCAEALKDGIADTPEKRANYADMIHRKASDMNRQIDELFLFSKLDLRRLPFYFERVELDAYLRSYVEEQGLDPRRNGVRIVYTGGLDGSLYVKADREKLGRALTNIVDNSVKYMDKADKMVRVGAQVGPKHVTVTISDNGRGIAPEALPYIFDRFYRAEPSRNRDTGGSGLGLAIVKQIIEAHGGTVNAESEPGRGTTISFTLPLEGRENEGEADSDH